MEWNRPLLFTENLYRATQPTSRKLPCRIQGWVGPWLVEASGRFEPPAGYGQRSWKPKVVQAFGCPMPWSPKPNMLKYTMTWGLRVINMLGNLPRQGKKATRASKVILILLDHVLILNRSCSWLLLISNNMCMYWKVYVGWLLLQQKFVIVKWER